MRRFFARTRKPPRVFTLYNIYERYGNRPLHRRATASEYDTAASLLRKVRREASFGTQKVRPAFRTDRPSSPPALGNRDVPPRRTKQGRPHAGRRFGASLSHTPVLYPSSTTFRPCDVRGSPQANPNEADRRMPYPPGFTATKTAAGHGVRSEKLVRPYARKRRSRHDKTTDTETFARKPPHTTQPLVPRGIRTIHIRRHRQRHVNPAAKPYTAALPLPYKTIRCGPRFPGTAPTVRTKTGRDGPKPSLPV